VHPRTSAVPLVPHIRRIVLPLSIEIPCDDKTGAIDLSGTTVNWHLRRKKMTYLVTGGTGFIGAHVTRLLIEQGYKIVVLCKKNNLI
jgi:NADPH:quinone reductase-like Zn-dependent oxidoreductase